MILHNHIQDSFEKERQPGNSVLDKCVFGIVLVVPLDCEAVALGFQLPTRVHC